MLSVPLDAGREGGLDEPLTEGDPALQLPSHMRFALDTPPPVSRGKPKRMVAMSLRRGGVVAGIEVHVLGERMAVTKRGEEAEVAGLLERL